MPPTRRRRCRATARLWLRLTLMLTLSVLGLSAVSAPARADAPPLLFAQNACTPVYDSPGYQGALVTQLLGGADVTPLASGSSAVWTHIHFWDELDGYVQPTPL